MPVVSFYPPLKTIEKLWFPDVLASMEIEQWHEMG